MEKGKKNTPALSRWAGGLLILGLCIWTGIVIVTPWSTGTAWGWAGLACVAGGAWLLQMDLRRKRLAEQAELDKRLAELEAAHAAELERVRLSERKEKEAFRSSLSHSLRMPIAIIQGYADLLAGEVVTEPEVQREYLEKIVQRTRDMTEVMSRQNILNQDLSREQLTYGQADLLALARQAAEDMKTAAREKRARIQVLSPEEALWAEVDSYLFNRVLFNLVENSLKYMGRPGTITIRVLRKEEQASVAVRDDGLGLSQQELGHIFELNYQGSNHAGGQGYGLYMVKKIVEAHGGQVSAESDLGQGMSVAFTLPLRKPGRSDKS